MGWGVRWEEGSGWGTRVFLWWIHVDVWKNQYNIVKLKNKIKQNVRRRKKKNLMLGGIGGRRRGGEGDDRG